MEINHSPISYQGLNRHLSKNVFNNETILELDRLYPKSNGIVGNVPPQWVRNMPVEQRQELIPKLYETIGEFISKILPIIPGDKLKSRALTYILKKYKAIGPKSSVQIYKIGKGELSKGYKIENQTDGYSLFLKYFKNTKRNKGLRKTGLHGAVHENNVKTYLKHDLKTKQEKEQFSNFYYGDIKNNYYIEEYLSRYRALPGNLLMSSLKNNTKNNIHNTLSNHGLRHLDLHSENVRYYFNKNDELYAKCFDLGGVDDKKNPILYCFSTVD